MRDDFCVLHIFVSAISALLIFLFFVASVKSWGFLGDDFAAVYAGNKGCRDGIGIFWSTYSNDQTVNPSNIKTSPSFFSVMFRPLTLIFYSLQVYLFDFSSAWPYFLVSVALHAVAVGLLCLFLLQFFTSDLAFLVSVCYGVYPLMSRFIGRISVQAYSICFILALICSFCFLKFLRTGRWLFAFLASVIFFIALLFNEIVIPSPAILFLFVILPDFSTKHRLRVFKFVVCMGGSVLAYLLTRLFCYPFNSLDENAVKLSLNFCQRFVQFLTMAVDTCAMTSLPGKTAIFKLLGLIFFALVVIYGFLCSDIRNKILIVLLFCSFVIASWPAFLFYYAHRYLYFALPFFLVALLICIQAFNWGRYFFCALVCFLICAGVFENVRGMREFASKAEMAEKIARQVSTMVVDQGVAICCVAMPLEFFPRWGSAQSVWLYSECQVPFFYDCILNCQVSLYDNSLYDVVPTWVEVNVSFDGSVVSLYSRHDRLWLQVTPENLDSCLRYSIGKIVALENYGNKTFKKIDFKLDDSIVRLNPIVAAWDYKEQKVVFYRGKKRGNSAKCLRLL